MRHEVDPDDTEWMNCFLTDHGMPSVSIAFDEDTTADWREFFVTCDYGNCEVWWGVSARSGDNERVLKCRDSGMEYEGWQYIEGRDYCPVCAKTKVLPV